MKSNPANDCAVLSICSSFARFASGVPEPSTDADRLRESRAAALRCFSSAAALSIRAACRLRASLIWAANGPLLGVLEYNA